MDVNISKKKQSKLPLQSIVICLFFSIGIAAGLYNYFDHDKTHGLITTVMILPGLIYHFMIVIKWFQNIQNDTQWPCSIGIIWAWDVFGIGIQVYKNAEISNYEISIDIQVLFLNVWIQLFRKHSA